MYGHVTASEDEDSKLIADQIYAFSDAPKELWLQFTDKEDYFGKQGELERILRSFSGRDGIAVYLRKERAVKHLERSFSVDTEQPALHTQLHQLLGEKNVRVSYKVLKKRQN